MSKGNNAASMKNRSKQNVLHWLCGLSLSTNSMKILVRFKNIYYMEHFTNEVGSFYLEKNGISVLNQSRMILQW